jgi:hypothetical protein
VSERAELFLGIIAFATAAVAVGQLCVVVFAGIAARRIARLAETVEQDLKPIFGHLEAIGRDASRAATLATAQVERADRLFGDIAVRVDQALSSVQTTMEQPAREGRALLAAFRAALAAVQDLRSRRAQARSDEEDALFI